MATAAFQISMIDVESSRIKQLGHDAETFTLAARFLPGKKSPRGKVYHYQNVSEEVWDDIVNPKTEGQSVGQAFHAIIIMNPERYPFECVDEGEGVELVSQSKAPVVQAAPIGEIVTADVPDDEEGLKTRALATRTEATAVVITTAGECELASHEVLRIRAERKIAVEKINRIKEPATQAWKAACALFNEVDGRYAEAESYLDKGILAYRAEVKRIDTARIAAENKRQAELVEAARKAQQEEFERRQKEANEEAARTAKQLAENDAAEAEARGATKEEVQEIIANPVPVAVRHVAPSPLAYVAAPAATIEPLNIPKVKDLSYTTEWFYEITDESQIPLTHEFYTLDLKKVNAKVQSLKKHANIPGVFVDSREATRKRVGKN